MFLRDDVYNLPSLVIAGKAKSLLHLDLWVIFKKTLLGSGLTFKYKTRLSRNDWVKHSSLALDMNKKGFKIGTRSWMEFLMQISRNAIERKFAF